MQPHLVDLLPGGEPVPRAGRRAVRAALLRARAARAGLGAARAAGAARAHDVSTSLISAAFLFPLPNVMMMRVESTRVR